MKGSPAEVERRMMMGPLIVILSLLYILELGFAGVFTYLSAEWDKDPEFCGDLLHQKYIILVFTTVVLWMDIATFLTVTFVFLHRYSPKKSEALQLDSFDRTSLEWEACLRIWCRIFRVVTCNLFGYVGSGEEADEIYRSVAETFNSWFSGTELSLSDLLAGVILIRLDQKRNQAMMHKYTPENNTISEYVPNAKAVQKHFGVLGTSVRSIQPAATDSESTALSQQAYQVLDDLNEHMPFMIALYGWKLQVYANGVRFKPLSALSNVIPLSPGALRFGTGDNCFRCSQQTVLKQTELNSDEVIYGQFSTEARDEAGSIQVPHALFVCKEKKELVISLRGTLSLQDLMTDAMIAPEALTTAGRCWGFDGASHYAHAGMLKVAMRIRGLLERTQVLHRLLGMDPRKYEQTYFPPAGHETEQVKIDWGTLPDCRGYKVVVVGHSLGAGVGAILTLMLRSTFEGTTCLAYAGPGAIFSHELAQESEKWCTNIFLGYDIVPHLNWQTLSRLRLKVFDMLYRCKVSKSRIMKSLFTGDRIDDMLYEPFEVPQTEGRIMLKQRMEYFEEKRKSKHLEQIPMYAPGKLLHLAKVETVDIKKWCVFSKKVRIFEPHWVLDRKVMQDPTFNSRNLFDHFPDLLPEVCADVLKRHAHHNL